VYETITAAAENIVALLKDPAVADKISPESLGEWVADRGSHSNDIVSAIASIDARSYIAEPKRGRRKWKGDLATRDVVYANRRRVKGERGRALMRRRGEYLERPFAHCLESGAMRRVHLRRCDNIAKRYLVHAAACNLALVMRTLFGNGTPKGAARGASSFAASGNTCVRLLVAARTHFTKFADMCAHFLNSGPRAVAA
jgi:hypothetical protein